MTENRTHTADIAMSSILLDRGHYVNRVRIYHARNVLILLTKLWLYQWLYHSHANGYRIGYTDGYTNGYAIHNNNNKNKKNTLASLGYSACARPRYSANDFAETPVCAKTMHLRKIMSAIDKGRAVCVYSHELFPNSEAPMDEHILPADEVAKLEHLDQTQSFPESNGLYGIAETSEAVVFFGLTASAAVRWRWIAPHTWLAGLERIVPAGVKALEGYEKIPLEMGDLSEDEVEQLVAVLLKNIDFSPLNVTEEGRALAASGELTNATETYGIAETSDVLKFLCKTAMYAVEFQQWTLAAITSALMELGPSMWVALSGIGTVTKELADLDDAELKQLYQVVAKTLDLADDKLEAAVEQAWMATLMLAQAVRSLMAALAKEVVDKNAAAKAFAGDIIRLVGHVAILVRLIAEVKSPPSSEPA